MATTLGGADITERPPARAEQVVEHAVDVGEHRELDLEVVPVVGEPPWLVSGGDDDREGITELVEVVAHGGHVLLARQSSEMAVQDQQQCSTAMVAEPPRVCVMVDEGDVGDDITLANHDLRPRARFRHDRFRSSVSITGACHARLQVEVHVRSDHDLRDVDVRRPRHGVHDGRAGTADIVDASVALIAAARSQSGPVALVTSNPTDLRHLLQTLDASVRLVAV